MAQRVKTSTLTKLGSETNKNQIHIDYVTVCIVMCVLPGIMNACLSVF